MIWLQRGDRTPIVAWAQQILNQDTHKTQSINIDGVYAAVLAEIGFPAEAANAVFIASRMAGVMAHVVEELTTMPPMRRIDPLAHSYDGPAARSLRRSTNSWASSARWRRSASPASTSRVTSKMTT